MSGFENFIYMFGAVSFACAVPTAMFCVVNLIEKQRKRQ